MNAGSPGRARARRVRVALAAASIGLASGFGARAGQSASDAAAAPVSPRATHTTSSPALPAAASGTSAAQAKPAASDAPARSALAKASPASSPAAIVLPRPNPLELLGREWLASPRLDIVPPCQWPEMPPLLHELAAQAATESAGAALRQLEPMLYRGPDAPDGAALLAATLRVRAAAPDRLAEAIDGLREIAATVKSAGQQYCVAIELAQGELRRGSAPEAAAEAVRAARLRTRLPDPVSSAEWADWLRAESLLHAGRISESRVVHDRLVRANDARLALAARLRLADARFDLDGPAFARAEYDALLPKMASLGISPSAWSLRFAEAQLAFGDVDTAIRQLELYLSTTPGPSRTALARLRLADAMLAKGDLEGARPRLVALTEEQPDSPFGRFAALRLASLSSGIERGRIERLDKIVTGADAALAAWARILRGRARIDAGEIDTALDELSLLARERVAAALEGALEDALTAVERLAAERTETARDCVVLARRLGTRARSLIPHASDPRPFLALGRCYERLGLMGGAADVYAALEAAFGPEVAALHEARVAVEQGNDRRASAALEAAKLGQGAASDAREAETVRAALELRAGEAANAATRLSQEIRTRSTEGTPVDAALLVRFARAVSRTADPSTAHAAQLAQELRSLPPSIRAESPAQVGEAAFLAGRVWLALGDAAAAAPLFVQAAALLPPGRLRAEAEVESAEQMDLESAEAARRRASDDPAGGGWARLARVDRRIEELEAELGVRPEDALPEGGGSVTPPAGDVKAPAEPALPKAEPVAPAPAGAATPAASPAEGKKSSSPSPPAAAGVRNTGDAREANLPLAANRARVVTEDVAGTLPAVSAPAADARSLPARWPGGTEPLQDWIRGILAGATPGSSDLDALLSDAGRAP